MENRPKVWRNFTSENNLDFDSELYESAINGKFLKFLSIQKKNFLEL